MSKTTLNPDAKTMGLGNTSKPIEDAELKKSSKSGDTYESVGASKWKAMGFENDNPLGIPDSPMEGIESYSSALGNALNEQMDSDMLGDPSAFIPATPLNLSRRNPAKDEYLKSFGEVELPPSIADTARLFPTDKKELKDTLIQTKAHYLSYLDLYNDRLANIKRGIKGGRESAYEVKISRQLVVKLEDAIRFTNKQLKYVDVELGKLGDI